MKNYNVEELKKWRVRIVLTCWIMYASYYLTRQNISIAIPSLKKDLNFTDIQIGWITTLLFLFYGLGQIIHGILGDKIGPRILGTIGMLISATINVLIGFFHNFYMFISLWSINGFFQATGAPLRIKVLSNWFPPKDRGKMMGILGTDYQFGTFICFVLCGILISHFGWKYVFIVPGIIFLFSAIHFYVRIRNSPEDVGFPPIEYFEKYDNNNIIESKPESLKFIFKNSFGNYRVWIVGLAYFGVDLIRYGFLIWIPTYMYEHGIKISSAAYKSVIIPIFGIISILLSGWLTDKLGGKRAPVITVMLLIVGIMSLIFKNIPLNNWFLSILILGLIGFFLYGPHLLMGATIAMDLGSRKASATASGLIDALGYLGSALSGIGTAYIKNLYGWNGTFIFWAFGAFFSSALMSLLWNYKPPKDRKYL